jgi:hypothetical protein
VLTAQAVDAGAVDRLREASHAVDDARYAEKPHAPATPLAEGGRKA